MARSSAKKMVFALVGLGLFCAMLRPPFFGSIIADPTPSPSLLRIGYDLTLLIVGLIFLVGHLTKGDFLGSNKAIAPTAFFGIASACSIALINVFRSLGVDSLVPYMICVVLIGCGVAFLALGWIAWLSVFPRKQTAAFAMAAFVLSILLGFFDISDPLIKSTATMLYPALSLLLLVAAQRGQPALYDEFNAMVQSFDPALRSSYFRKLFSLSLMFIVVELICGAFLRSRWAQGGVYYAPNSDVFVSTILVSYAVSALMGLVFIVVSLRSRTVSQGTLIIGGIGIALLVVVSVSFASLSSRICHPIVTGLYSALLVYLLAQLAMWATDAGRALTLSTAMFIVLYAVINFISNTLVPSFLSFTGSMPDVFLTGIAIVAGLVIAIGICIVMFVMLVIQREAFEKVLIETDALPTNAPQYHALPIEEPDTQSDSSEQDQTALDREQIEVFKAMLAQYDLTSREMETAILLARGYSAKRVAEELVVASSTVQGYSKNIYRKMNIHKKDQLIEAFNKARP